MPLRRPLWILVTVACVAFPLLLVVLGGHTLEWRDTPRVHAPLRPLVVEALRDLRLPLWNPHEGTGVPLFAQLVQSVLHPVSVLAAFLAPGAGLDLLIVLHVLLAAGGVAFLARSAGCSPAASAAAGFAFGLSGYVLSMASALHLLAAAGTAPWTIAALRAAGSNPRRFALAALAVCVLHFAGDPQWALVAAGLGVALAVEHAGRRGLAWAVSATLLGTALAAVQLAPAWSLLGASMRGTAALTAEERALWALAPARVVEFVAPGFFGGVPGPLAAPVFLELGAPPAAPGSIPVYTLPFLSSVCIGASVLVLALGWGVRVGRLGRVLAVAAVVFCWLALGTYAGADPLLRGIPIWGSFRYAEKYVGPLSLVLALLAALGIDALGLDAVRAGAAGTGTPAPGVKRGPVIALGVAAGVIGLAGGVCWSSAGGDLVRGQLGRGLCHAAIALAVLAAIFALARRRASSDAPADASGRVWARSVPRAVALLVYVELLAAAPYAIHAGAPDARERAPHAGLARADGAVVRLGVPLRGVTSKDSGGLDPLDAMLAVESRLGVTPFPAACGIDQVENYTALLPRALVVVDNALGWPDDPNVWRHRRRYGMSHVVVRNPRGPREAARAAPAIDGGSLVSTDSRWHFSIYAVPHRPWASFATGVIPASGEEEILRAVRDATARPWSEVVLEGPPPPGLSPGRVLSIERTRERIRVEAESDGPALLVVNDAAWPGWQATIDGVGVAVQRADGLVRAIPWPAGRHVLEMRYAPPELRLGQLVSLGAAIVFGIAAAWKPRAETRTRETARSVRCGEPPGT